MDTLAEIAEFIYANPPGFFHIVDLHQTAFNSRAMQVEWRARTLTMPQYRTDLDLFIVNVDDQPVAFCIG